MRTAEFVGRDKAHDVRRSIDDAGDEKCGRVLRGDGIDAERMKLVDRDD